MTDNEYYDYIIVGCGCAGLSMAVHLIESGKFTDKRILIIDKDKKNKNDRTWCFWEMEDGPFQDIVFKTWDYLLFSSKEHTERMAIAPYSYKMIRGIDYYNYCINKIINAQNFTLQFSHVSKIFSSDKCTGIVADNKTIYCSYIFNSVVFQKPVLTKNKYWLLQHFKGWLVNAASDVFDNSTATLMDFNIQQEEGAVFCYVLPFSPRTALVEYTVISREAFAVEKYDRGLRAYIENVLKVGEYTITETEVGSIPMTNFKFKTKEGNITNIGTAGGQTKASSGYTFNFIQRQSKELVDNLIEKGSPCKTRGNWKFAFYDSIFLSVLYKNKMSGASVFTKLFRNNRPQQVLKFLDNKTSVPEDLTIIRSLPFWPFLSEAFNQFF